MSASREKRLRQELAASGTPDPKKVREEEELRKQRRTNRLYILIAVIFVAVTALVLLWNSNVIQRGTTAATVDGVNYSAMQTDEDEMQITYDELDKILYGFEQEAGDKEISEFSGATLEKIQEIRARVRSSEHKRLPPVRPEQL